VGLWGIGAVRRWAAAGLRQGVSVRWRALECCDGLWRTAADARVEIWRPVVSVFEVAMARAMTDELRGGLWLAVTGLEDLAVTGCVAGF
jgi:hypothetical protein